MKTAYLKTRIVLLILLCTIPCAAQLGWMGGIGPSVELPESLLGVNTRLYYGTSPTFCFGPEVSFFPYQQVDEEYELSILELNANVHYIFELSHKLGVYPLGGINYTVENERLISDNDSNEEENGFGLNYGFGVHYNLTSLFIFSEFKGIIGPLNDEFFTVGVILPIGRQHQEKEHHQK